METMCGQAFGAGPRSYGFMGIVLQRGILVGSAVSVPIIVAWCHAERILVALGQDVQVSASAAVYLRAIAPAIVAVVVAECIKKYQIAQVRSKLAFEQ